MRLGVRSIAAIANAPKMRKRKLSKRGIVYAVLTPTVLYFALFFYYPFFTNVVWMFTDYNFLNSAKFVGLKNIAHFFDDPYAWKALKNTFVITLVSTPLTLGVSLALAMAVFYLKLGKAVIRGAIFSTYIVSTIVAAITFKVWFNDELGYVNSILTGLGVKKVAWLTDPFWAMVAIIMLSVWLLMGYFMVIFLAGISGIDTQQLEAGMMDGANKRQLFFRITLPQLKPIMIFSSIIAVSIYLKTYPSVVILTNGGPYRSTETILMYMFDQGFVSRNVGYASVLGIVIFLITMFISLLQLKLTKFFSEQGG
ncbi:multiple sugar transport system permease protein/lactose/L-arabinose transport system permease protein [Cohnella phaseoli]|uniref:Multiple sugar transport system permease protein/lactose/L-arabinose transport system permease protein n=2 Tax=Cohnella phaseoli TaxID=456490 RepID=A0A3D9KC60_9BACL|nr:multiple sugar transport system permease protein/lactose/L-arabinose transport system permease protein [Cohnella phaseoli]